jgi:signal transduction histidine kinase
MASISYGERTAIFEYWSGYDLGVQPATATRAAWITPTLWGMAGFGLITVAWIGLLRRTVASRTSQLRQLNNELENRVHERTSELEEANRYLDGFASSVSHDLQQPLNVLRLENKLASMRVEKGETPNFEKIERQIIRMSGFIETMLHFSRGERSLELVNVPLEPIVREIEAVYGESEDAKAEITVAKDLVAYCDPQLIRIVLLNIVGNAWKFSAQHSGAKIEVGGDGTEFFVRDNGPGFDADTLGEDVFKPFVRGGTEGNVGGTGVGLATAARIVRRHGGKIWVESSPGNGATFTFTFPPPNK